MKEGLKPTRMELLNAKQKLVLAQKGHEILKQKRDALVLEFFAIIKQAQDLRSRLDGQVETSYKSLAVAQAFHGSAFLQTAALASKRAPEIDVFTKNVMGVKIPGIRGVFVHRSLIQRGYPVVGSSAKFDEAVSDFELSLEFIIKLAESEAALKRLLKEIEKTNRRVNALEYVVQPDLKTTIKDVTQHLTMLESELFYALKATKRRLAKKAEAEAGGLLGEGGEIEIVEPLIIREDGEGGDGPKARKLAAARLKTWKTEKRKKAEKREKAGAQKARKA